MAYSQRCVNEKLMANSLMAKKTIQTEDKYIVRFPDGMRDRIRIEAELNGRSMNAEITTRLQQTLDAQDGKVNETAPGVDPASLQNTLVSMSEELRRLGSLIDARVVDVTVWPNGDEDVTISRKARSTRDTPKKQDKGGEKHEP